MYNLIIVIILFYIIDSLVIIPIQYIHKLKDFNNEIKLIKLTYYLYFHKKYLVNKLKNNYEKEYYKKLDKAQSKRLLNIAVMNSLGDISYKLELLSENFSSKQLSNILDQKEKFPNQLLNKINW